MGESAFTFHSAVLVRRRSLGSSASGSVCSFTKLVCPGRRAAGVVVVEASRLQKIHRNRGQTLDHLASNDGTDDQGHEDDEHEEIQHGKADDSTLAKLRLLERVDWRSDLTTGIVSAQGKLDRWENGYIPWSKPEQHH